MNKIWRWVFLILFAGSVTLNLYLLTSSKQTNTADSAQASSIRLTSALLNQPSSKEMPEVSATIGQQQPNLANRPQQQNHEQLLAQANQWLSTKELITLEDFLQAYLKQHPQDMDFLLIEAQLKVETVLLSEAINHYYDLLRVPMTAAQNDYIQQQIKSLTNNTIEQLSNNYSWDTLAKFVEPLLQLEPNNRQYILSLANAYAELYQAGLMENVLASLALDDPAAQKIRQIHITQQTSQPIDDSADPELSTKNTRPIPLKHIGDHYVVNASLSSNPVTLLIDTGASITAISRAFYDTLSNRYKINFLGRFNINTAGGRIMAPMYQFRELTIQHVTLENITVVIIPMQGMEHADGLLGMNFLREFDFKIDQAHSVLFLD
jgi:clan AA aspartic protease (TIGR02281 family)